MKRFLLIPLIDLELLLPSELVDGLDQMHILDHDPLVLLLVPDVILDEFLLQGVDAGLEVCSLLDEVLLLVDCCLDPLLIVLDVFVVQFDQRLLQFLKIGQMRNERN